MTEREPAELLPPRAGVGLKAFHYAQVVDGQPDVGWFEIHPENYMGRGGAPHAWLGRVRRDYPLSMHGVGMSLGSADGVPPGHLNALVRLVERYQPEVVSEHLAWSHWNSVFFNDLLPLPYTRESLQVVCNNVERVQDALKRPILVENPSLYLQPIPGDFDEVNFLAELAQRSGCRLLLDVNNVFVSSHNLGSDPRDYLAAVDPGQVGEIHLAGHSVDRNDGSGLRIDDHGSPVCDEVWRLYCDFISRANRPIPTLIEWDSNIPAWETLYAEARRADAILNSSSHAGEAA